MTIACDPMIERVQIMDKTKCISSVSLGRFKYPNKMEGIGSSKRMKFRIGYHNVGEVQIEISLATDLV